MNAKYKGIICIVCSAGSFALMNVFIRLAGDVPSLQKTFFRNLIAFFVALAVMKKDRVGFSGKKENLGILVVRSVFGLIGMLGNFYAVDHLMLADASMLSKMSPFFAILFSFLVLKERITLPQMLAVAGAFLGSLLIIRPSGTNMLLVPALAGLFGGMSAGCAYTLVRLLGSRGEKGPFIVCFFSGFSTLALLPVILFDYTPMSLYQLLCLLGVGVAAAGGQFGVTMAYCYAPAREISVYDYSQILFSAVFGYLLFGQMPDGWSFLGYLVIGAMAVWMFLYQKKAAESLRWEER